MNDYCQDNRAAPTAPAEPTAEPNGNDEGEKSKQHIVSPFCDNMTLFRCTFLT